MDFQPHYGVLEAETIHFLSGAPVTGPVERTGAGCALKDVVRFLPPVDPPNIIALGLNYLEHAKESRMELPPAPVIFLKATTSLIGHLQPIRLPREAPDEVDYEAELAVVIGRTARNVTEEQAGAHVFGYTCGNDVSARDCQFRQDKQWARGKSFDTFAPIGPWIETELDPARLCIRSLLNGRVMQDAGTGDLIFKVPRIISYLSRQMTLPPGTVIMTGTPPGVGFARKEPVFLRPGDTIEVDIEGIGVLRNPVVAEP